MASAVQAERYAFSAMWPENANNWYFDKPGGVAVDGSGNVYVADTNNNRVKKYAANGSPLAEWGGFGSGDGQFNAPGGVAVDSSGNVFVADTGNHRIQKLDSAGSYVTKWGTSGTADGEFASPAAIAVDSSGNVYVADTGNNRIQKFDGSGSHLGTYAGAGFSAPKALAIDGVDGAIFVADAGNNRIQKLDATGAYVAEFGSAGTGDGQFAAPGGLAVDSLRNVYVADTDNNRIQKFTTSDPYLVYAYSAQFGSFGSNNAQFNKPGGMAIDGDGDLWMVDTGNDRIKSHDTAGTYLAAWSSSGFGNDKLHSPGDMALDDAGNIYVADTYNSRIQKFDVSWAYQTTWGGQGTDPGEFFIPGGLTRDADGNFYVADSGNNRLQKLNSSGVHQLTIGSAGSADGQLADPCGLTVDGDGNIYVADGDNNRLQKFDAAGGHLLTIGGPGTGTGDGEFNNSGSVVLDEQGNIYATDSVNCRVQKFNATGTFLAEWGQGCGSGADQFTYPRYIIRDSQGNFLVSDNGNDRIKKLDADGNVILAFGSEGAGQGEFNWPRGMRIDAQGRLFVVDSHNDRIQVFQHMLDITTSAGAGGTITDSTEVQEGQNLTVNITPSAGYAVADVLVDGSSVGAVTSYELTNVVADHTVSATFETAEYTITASAGDHGSITPSGPVTVSHGGSQSFTITPADGYEVADVLVDGSSVGAVTSYDFTGVVANHTISVTFQLQTFTITASAGTGGSISPEGEVNVNWGADQGFTITAGTGYNIADVLVDGSSVGAVGSYTFNDVTEGHTIAASFIQKTFTISTSTPGGHGTITPGGTVNYGDSFPVTITPDSGYQVLGVTVDGVSQGAITGYTFTDIQANHAISATFTPIMQTITASVTPANMGQISPSGSVQVAYGASQSFTITPNPGQRVKAVLVDTIDVGKVTSYQFANVTADHEIVAQFEQGTTSLAAIYLLLLGDQQVTLEALETDEEGQPLAQE
jgi:DNA-binding beta-propeller fold protein YncE